MQSKKFRLRRARRGGTMVEFALSWTAMWLLFSGVYQFGYAFYIYNALMTSVANAAELGSKLQYDAANPSGFTTTLQNMVLYGDETAPASKKTIVPGLTASNVNVAINYAASSSPTLNTFPTDITITITGYKINAVFTSFTLTGRPRATTAYMGNVVCSTC
jgi:Flp pilus assembly protein TadG